MLESGWNDQIASTSGNRRGARHQNGLLRIGRIAWALAAVLALAASVLTLPVRHAQLVTVAAENRPYLEQVGLTEGFLIAYLTIFDAVAMAAFSLIAAVIVWRKSGDGLALLVSAMLMLMSVLLTRPVESVVTMTAAWRLPFLMTLTLGTAAIILFMFLFPNGRFVPSWSRWLALAWVVWLFAWYLAPAVSIQTMSWPPRIQPAWAVAGWIGSGLAIQIYRYRSVSSVTQRQQTKWIIAGLVAAAFGFVAYLYLAPTLIPALQPLGRPHLLYILIGVPVLYLSLLMLPASIGISILRYRLWDIGVIINRTLVYGVLSVLLTAVYLGFVLLLQPLFRSWTGSNSLIVIAISTLTTAVLFYPLRQRVQAGIDRRLFRRKYDAAQILVDLNARLRDEVDLTRLTGQLESAIGNTLRPASLFSWLRTASGFRVYLPIDTRFSVDTVEWVDGEIPLDEPFIAYLNGVQDDVVSLERVDLDSPALRRLKAAGVSQLMLLCSRGELVGWLSLGPRLNEQGFSADDLRFLEMVAAQAGPAVGAAQMALDQQAAALERQSLDQQLRLAQTVQQTLLPHGWPSLQGWRVDGHYRPAQAIGGDFYDVLTFKDGRVAIIIGDVSDKGIPAAMLMASTRSLLRSVAYQLVTPAAVLQRTNRLLYPDLPEGLFVTCLYALLDPRNGCLSFANAGHNPPYYRSAAEVTEMWLAGMPLGWMPDTSYDEREMTIRPGECLFLYSDGLTEARNAQGAMFGNSRLLELLTETRVGGSDLVESILKDMADFHGAVAPDDDVTIVTLERSADTEPAAASNTNMSDETQPVRIAGTIRT